jgi:hypothetical protein
MKRKRKESERPALIAPPEQLLTTEEAATVLRLAKNTLDKMRVYGSGPRFVYAGRFVRYTPSAIADFITESTRTSTSQTTPPHKA